jgi:hypothetical protein
VRRDIRVYDEDVDLLVEELAGVLGLKNEWVGGMGCFLSPPSAGMKR